MCEEIPVNLDDVKVMCIRNKYAMIHKVEPVANSTDEKQMVSQSKQSKI